MQRVAVPNSGVELRIDAPVFRAHVPQSINVEPDVTGAHASLSFGVEERPFHTSHYGGFGAIPGSVITEILPTGPGYAMLVSRGSLVDRSSPEAVRSGPVQKLFVVAIPER